MIPSSDRFGEIASLRRGDFQQVPYPVLLTALARARRTVVVRMARKPVEKTVFVHRGAPVDCRSNLVHETFGRFLVAQGKLSDEQFNATLSESLSREIPLGEVLLEHELLEAVEMYKLLQQSLARKLLDGFTWQSGTFELEGGEVDAATGLRVNAPQLVLTGVVKLSPMKEVMGAIQPWLSDPLAVEPEPVFGAEELQLPGATGRVVETLRQRAQRVDELAATTRLAGDELGRILYALALLGVVVPAAQVGRPTRDRPAVTAGGAAPAPARPADAAPDPEAARADILQTYLSFKRKDSLELFDLAEDAGRAAIEEAWIGYAARFAPWRAAGLGKADLAEKARILFLAGAAAYAELADDERRGALLYRRKTLADEKARKPAQPKIETDLLDPAIQFRKGKELLEAGEHGRALEFLRFAADVDPQNALYRAEAAYCQYIFSPTKYREDSLAELEEAARIDPRNGLALYYLGMVEMGEGQLARAEEHLQRSIKLMAPDRRPIEALKKLTTAKAKR
jgi:tetratricopeptide (TPR) repeat protein